MRTISKDKKKWQGIKGDSEKDPTKGVNCFSQCIWFGIGLWEQVKSKNKGV